MVRSGSLPSAAAAGAAAARRRASLAAVSTGLAADWLLGEPPAALHPVAAFGRAMTWLERHSYADSRGRGMAYACTGVGAAAVMGWALAELLEGPGGGRARPRCVRPAATDRAGGCSPSRPPRPGPSLFVATCVATYVAVAGRALALAASEVARDLQAGDLEAARLGLPALVGRDPSGLDEVGMSRAVVESVAENTVDAVVAPAVWATLGGPAAALAYRAVNTLDAMVGHRTARYGRFGWASARADDLAGWVPARLTALLVAVVRPTRARSIWRAVRWQAAAHPSPNAGVAEAAFAAALQVRLGGVNVYAGRPERRPSLGSGRAPQVGDIPRAIRLSRHVTAALALACLAGSGPWGSP
jgi:adenosylcobinamide-phosphate synthase